jgi:hypothetical protein
MKVEVQFIGASVDTEVYEADRVTWVADAGYLSIFRGTEEETKLVAAYPEHRIVRVRIV